MPALHFTGASRTARRYDHVFVSRQLRPVRCEYLGDWLEAGWSDHAAAAATFEITSDDP